MAGTVMTTIFVLVLIIGISSILLILPVKKKTNTQQKEILIGDTPIYDQLVRDHNNRGWLRRKGITNGY